jgi:hypothetical protein
MRYANRLLRFVLILFRIWVLAVAGIFLWSLAFPPLQPVALVSHPDPAPGYAAAVARFDSLLAADRARGDLDPKCLPVLLTHGHKTARVIVLFHSVTACPYQYHALGELFFEQGYNVYIPRLARHGLAARESNALHDLTSEELAAAVDPAVDLADGLGDEVTVAGLSLGGDVTALAGQLRADVQLAAPISPAFGLRIVPGFLTPSVARLLVGLPDFYVWWDPIHQDQFPGDSGYPGFSSHALGQILRLALAERDLAQTTAPRAHRLLVITNWGDPGVSLWAADDLAAAWEAQGASVQTFRFALLPWLPHDFISTDAPFGRVELVYPELLRLLAVRASDQ